MLKSCNLIIIIIIITTTIIIIIIIITLIPAMPHADGATRCRAP
jgi:hypothetical protein